MINDTDSMISMTPVDWVCRVEINLYGKLLTDFESFKVYRYPTLEFGISKTSHKFYLQFSDVEKIILVDKVGSKSIRLDQYNDGFERLRILRGHLLNNSIFFYSINSNLLSNSLQIELGNSDRTKMLILDLVNPEEANLVIPNL